MDLNSFDIRSETVPSFSKTRIATHFGLKVSRYERYAVIQRQLIERLLPMIMDGTEPGDRWVDIGCGNGALEHDLLQLGWRGVMTGMDIAFESLRYCRDRISTGTDWLCADADLPPLQGGQFRGMVITSTLQWSSRPGTTVSNLVGLLQPGGLLVFSIFTTGAFRELFATRSRLHLPPPVSVLDEDTVEPMLRRSGLEPLSMQPFSATEYFPSAGVLLRHLSAIGSTGLSPQPLSRSRLQEFCDILETDFRTGKGVPLTYRAWYGVARKGDGKCHR